MPLSAPKSVPPQTGSLSPQGQYLGTPTTPPAGLGQISLKGWSTPTSNLLYFTVSNRQGFNIAVTLDSASNALVVNVTINASAPAVENWWSVDVGTGSRGIDWPLNFSLRNTGTKVGTWIFVKSGVIGD